MARSDAEQQSEAQRVSRALAEAAIEAEERKADETVPGGRFRAGDRLVNANGEPIEDTPAEDKPERGAKDPEE